MAVYTDVAAEELAEFLKGYDIGELLSYKGIAEGVENSNFLLHTTKGAFILTLYEKRVAEDDLPYFLSLMAHLAEHGVQLPAAGEEPQRRGLLRRSPAGRPRSSISSKACGRGGRTRRIAPASARRWPRCIWRAATFRCTATIRCRSPAGGRCSIARADRADSVAGRACATSSRASSTISKRAGRPICRSA